MSEYKIEKGVPLLGKNRPGKDEYPFSRLEVDESFLVPCEKGTKEVHLLQTHLCSMANKACMHNNKRFTTRTVNGGIRVWRMK